MIAPWPQSVEASRNAQAYDKMQLVQNIVVAIRTLRSESVLPPGLKLECQLRNLSSKARELLEDKAVHEFIIFLARLEKLSYNESDPKARRIPIHCFQRRRDLYPGPRDRRQRERKSAAAKEPRPAHPDASAWTGGSGEQRFPGTRAQRGSGKPPNDFARDPEENRMVE